MTDTVHVIVSGESDGYRVHAVIRGTLPDAELLADRANGDDTWRNNYRIETLPVVDADAQPVTIIRANQDLGDDGFDGTKNLNVSTEWPFDMLYAGQDIPAGWRWVRAPCHGGKGGRLEVYGTDSDAVLRLFDDMKTAIRTHPALRGSRERTGRGVPPARKIARALTEEDQP